MLRYHDFYGYPYRWAIPGELAWRLEHLPLFDWTPEREEANGIGWRICSSLRSWGYRNRKACEHRGYALSPRGRREKDMYG